jgi:hypothetical protein
MGMAALLSPQRSADAIASTRAGCAFEVTPPKRRATSDGRKGSQAAPSSALTTSSPSDSRTPSRLTPTTCTTRRLRCGLPRALDHQRVKRSRTGTGRRRAAEGDMSVLAP